MLGSVVGIATLLEYLPGSVVGVETPIGVYGFALLWSVVVTIGFDGKVGKRFVYSVVGEVFVASEVPNISSTAPFNRFKTPGDLVDNSPVKYCEPTVVIPLPVGASPG